MTEPAAGASPGRAGAALAPILAPKGYDFAASAARAGSRTSIAAASASASAP